MKGQASVLLAGVTGFDPITSGMTGGSDKSSKNMKILN
jgi:hypothetical protein